MKVTTSGFKGISFLPCNYYEKDLFLNCILVNGAKMREEWTRESSLEGHWPKCGADELRESRPIWICLIIDIMTEEITMSAAFYLYT